MRKLCYYVVQPLGYCVEITIGQLNHSEGEAEKVYRELAMRRASVRVGMETTGYSRWFERLLAELGMELWIGDAAEIKTTRVRKQRPAARTVLCGGRSAMVVPTATVLRNTKRRWRHDDLNKSGRHVVYEA